MRETLIKVRIQIEMLVELGTNSDDGIQMYSGQWFKEIMHWYSQHLDGCLEVGLDLGLDVAVGDGGHLDSCLMLLPTSLGCPGRPNTPTDCSLG